MVNFKPAMLFETPEERKFDTGQMLFLAKDEGESGTYSVLIINKPESEDAWIIQGREDLIALRDALNKEFPA